MDNLTDYRLAYEKLAKLSLDQIALRKEYRKNKSPDVLIRLSQNERWIDEMVNPKPYTQAQLEFLGR